MGVPLDAFKLLSTKDEVEAGVLAKHLDEKNSERKGVVGSMIREIKKKIEDKGEGVRSVLVFGNPEWKPSLLGLVANSFSDEHGRPSFFWGRNGETESDEKIIKGSCRSGSNINIVKLMEKTKESFLDYGGHHGAGGFSVLPEKIHTLEEDLNRAFEELEKTGELLDEEEVWVDKVLSLDDVSWNTWRDLEKFQPFGLDNPKPLFLFENIQLQGVKLFGKEKNHLELKFKNGNGKDVTAMAFFKTDTSFDRTLKAGDIINLVATLEKSEFRNFAELRLRIVDVF
jgi:single-stranded-DNA-specific exonuclease